MARSGWGAGLMTMVRVGRGDPSPTSAGSTTAAAAAAAAEHPAMIAYPDSSSESAGDDPASDILYDEIDDAIDHMVLAQDTDIVHAKQLFPHSHKKEAEVAFSLFEKMTREVLRERNIAAQTADPPKRNAPNPDRHPTDLPLHFDSQPLAEVLEDIEALLAGAGPIPLLNDDPALSAPPTPTSRKALALTRRWRRIFAEMKMASSVGVWASTILPLPVRLAVNRQLIDVLSRSAVALVDGDVDHQHPNHRDSSAAENSSGSVDGGKEKVARRIVGDFDLVSRSQRKSRYTAKNGQPLSEEREPDRALAWENPAQARIAVMREALKARYGSALTAPAASMMAGAPVVLIVRQKRLMNPLGSKESLKERIEDETYAFRLWQAACMGMCLVKLVEVPTEDQLGLVVSTVMKNDVLQASLSPILVVLRASIDSSLLAGAQALREVCDAYNARLHTEGPSLALLCQSDPPQYATECRRFSHSLLIEPATWFGFPTAAVLTYMRDGSVAAREEAEDEISNVVSSVESGLPAMLSLWMFFKRSGIVQLRLLVEEATQRAAQLMEGLAAVPNIETVTIGDGGNVVMSHAMSRVDRVMRKYKARERISQINASFLGYLEKEASPLKIVLHEWTGQSWMLFAPVRLLQGGRMYVPSEETIHSFVSKIAQVARAHEIASSGITAFHNIANACRDVVVLGETENVVSASLGFGVTRIIPTEFRRNWRDIPIIAAEVEHLNKRLVSLVLDRQRTELRNKNKFVDFKCFLDYSFIGPCICVDPSLTTVAADAPKTAAFAATLVVECTEDLLDDWRHKNLLRLQKRLDTELDGDLGLTPAARQYSGVSERCRTDKYRVQMQSRPGIGGAAPVVIAKDSLTSPGFRGNGPSTPISPVRQDEDEDYDDDIREEADRFEDEDDGQSDWDDGQSDWDDLEAEEVSEAGSEEEGTEDSEEREEDSEYGEDSASRQNDTGGSDTSQTPTPSREVLQVSLWSQLVGRNQNEVTHGSDRSDDFQDSDSGRGGEEGNRDCSDQSEIAYEDIEERDEESGDEEDKDLLETLPRSRWFSGFSTMGRTTRADPSTEESNGEEHDSGLESNVRTGRKEKNRASSSRRPWLIGKPGEGVDTASTEGEESADENEEEHESERVKEEEEEDSEEEVQSLGESSRFLGFGWFAGRDPEPRTESPVQRSSDGDEEENEDVVVEETEDEDEAPEPKEREVNQTRGKLLNGQGTLSWFRRPTMGGAAGSECSEHNNTEGEEEDEEEVGYIEEDEEEEGDSGEEAEESSEDEEATGKGGMAGRWVTRQFRPGRARAYSEDVEEEGGSGESGEDTYNSEEEPSRSAVRGWFNS